jgi:hypothetical protein
MITLQETTLGAFLDSVQKFSVRRKTGPQRFRWFLKFLKKSAKFKKIQPKLTRADGETLEIGNIKIRPVLTINRLISPINQRFSQKLVWRFSGEFCQKPGNFCRKSVNGTKNSENQRYDIY